MKIRFQILFISLVIISTCLKVNAAELSGKDIAVAQGDQALLGKNTSSATRALWTAARSGDAKFVKSLLEKGADPNAYAATDGITALTIAAQACHAEIIRLLIENGANIHQMGAFGTALTLAVEDGCLDVVRALLEKGADVNETPNVYTPLILAVRKGNAEMVRLLVEKGADVNMKVTTGPYEITALQIAENFGMTNIIKILEQAGAK